MMVKRWIRVAALSALAGLIGCAPYGWPRSGEKIIRNVVFSQPNNHPLRMDLYVPKTATPAPVVVWIFGGSWKFGSKAYHVNLRDLTRSGIAVAAIEYRLSGTAIYPAQLQDCEAAVEWLRAHGAEVGIDPKRIGVSGESSGGHLAALLGTVEGKAKIRAVCALYPPTDLITLGAKYENPKQLSNIDRLLGGRVSRKISLAKEASPLEHVSNDSPPFLLIHGANDTLVPLDQSQQFDEKLKRVGVESRLSVVPEKGHWFLLNPAQLSEVAQFFCRHFGMAPTGS